MKTEMQMLPNGNYERVISPVQHRCMTKDYGILCIEYGWDEGRLILQIEDGDPYEGGYSNEIEVSFCPFCGYRPERLNPEASKEDAIV
jgi:hypothetical protein